MAVDYEDDDRHDDLFEEWRNLGNPVNYGYSTFLADKVKELQAELLKAQTRADAAERTIKLLKAFLEDK